MKAKELRPQSADQLQQTRLALESELLRHVSSVSANSSEAKKRREIRKDLARVLTLQKQKKV